MEPPFYNKSFTIEALVNVGEREEKKTPSLSEVSEHVKTHTFSAPGSMIGTRYLVSKGNSSSSNAKHPTDLD